MNHQGTDKDGLLSLPLGFHGCEFWVGSVSDGGDRQNIKGWSVAADKVKINTRTGNITVVVGKLAAGDNPASW
ncbi:hypothetical protein IQ252_24710 [Tychonema sp. LEGE 07203]|nr:hypothetical protein [Tychonema sp. LEGE 07203]